MNWLAHVFLSEKHIEHQLGNLLSNAKAVDFVYAIFIFGIGVFTPEQFSLKKLKSLALGLGEGFKRIDRRLSERVLAKETTFGC